MSCHFCNQLEKPNRALTRKCIVCDMEMIICTRCALHATADYFPLTRQWLFCQMLLWNEYDSTAKITPELLNQTIESVKQWKEDWFGGEKIRYGYCLRDAYLEKGFTSAQKTIHDVGRFDKMIQRLQKYTLKAINGTLNAYELFCTLFSLPWARVTCDACIQPTGGTPFCHPNDPFRQLLDIQFESIIG